MAWRRLNTPSNRGRRTTTRFDLSEDQRHDDPAHARCPAGRREEQGDWSECARLAAAQSPWVVPIPRARMLERLEENLGGVDVAPSLPTIFTKSKAPSRSSRYNGPGFPKSTWGFSYR